MYRIDHTIRLLKAAAVDKKEFINEATRPSAWTQFHCTQCGEANPLLITPYESGFPILSLYDGTMPRLKQEELLEHKALQHTHQSMLHVGALTVRNLPTLYFGTDCHKCNTPHICIFGYGEQQPGLEILEVSGVWQYAIR
ncbi:hypothetical protein D3C72_1007470 [compost metagenome]